MSADNLACCIFFIIVCVLVNMNFRLFLFSIFFGRQFFKLRSILMHMSSSSQSHHAEVDALVEKIMKNGTLPLKTKSLKYLVLLLLTLGFTVGIIILLEGGLFGWVAVGFFGFAACIAASAVCGYRFYLVLTPEGFTVQTLILTYSYQWTDIEQFKTGWNYFIKTVWFKFSDSYENQSILGKMGRVLNPFNIRNLPDTYGMKAETLTELMNTLRERALHSGELSV